MKISPVNFKQHNSHSFKGVMEYSHNESYDDNAQEVIVDIDHYNYHPFKDETKEEIEKVINKHDRTKYQVNPYPTYSTLTGVKVEVKPPLSITKEQYLALKTQSLDDHFIIKTFE